MSNGSHKTPERDPSKATARCNASEQNTTETSTNPFLTKEDLIKHLAGQMFPQGKNFAPSLVMWGDPHHEERDLDHLDHLAPPETDDNEE
ncbi:MAG: hypothetical protein AAF494_14095 [Pseudomonadota bacterium]